MENNTVYSHADVLEASLTLVNNKLNLVGKAGNFQPISTDYIPPLGDGEGYMPLQLFLISLGSCASASVLTMLRRMGKTIISWNVKVNGQRRTEHPLSFSKITIEFIVSSPDITTAEINKAIMLSEQTYCPIWAMIKGNVEVITEVKLEILSEN